MFKLIGVSLLTISCATVSAVAVAGPSDNFFDDHAPAFFHDDHGPSLSVDTGMKMMAPEIDPSSALSAMTLLFGGLTVLRARVVKR